MFRSLLLFQQRQPIALSLFLDSDRTIVLDFGSHHTFLTLILDLGSHRTFLIVREPIRSTCVAFWFATGADDFDRVVGYRPLVDKFSSTSPVTVRIV
jgi:hypothetical protein